MIPEIVKAWEENKPTIRKYFEVEHQSTYKDIIKNLIECISDEDEFEYGECPDPDRIHEIDDGDYQGTLVFVIGAYQNA